MTPRIIRNAVLILLLAAPSAGQRPTLEFHYNYRPDTFEALHEHIARTSLVVPEWFVVDGEGRVRGAVEPRVLELARRHDVPVMAQVKNLDREQGRFRPDWAHDLFTNADVRRRAIATFLELCRAHGLNGIQLELEGVHVRDRDGLTRFVRAAAAALHDEGFRLSVSAVHREADAPDDAYSRWLWEHWRGVYDLGALGEAADFVRVVAYAQHTRRTPPGPSQSLPWLERVLAHFVDAVPAGKLVLGLGMGTSHWYTVADPDLYHLGARSWSRSIRRTELRSILDRHGVTLTWDPRQGMAHGFFERTGVFEWLVTDNDVRAFEAKSGLARRLGLRGVSMWVDGDEDPAIWSRFHPRRVATRSSEGSARPTGGPASTSPTSFGGVPVLAWHYFVEREEDVDGVLTDTFARLEALLGFLAEHGFESVFPEEARAPGAGGSRQVILTFDDGRKEHLRAAALLEEHGFRGVFFVIPERVGDGSGAYLTGEDLERLAGGGHRVAVHGFDHLSLPKAGSEVAGALTVAADRLRERGGVSPSTLEFAFPYGHYTPGITAALGTRYRYLMTVNPGYWEPGALLVPRMLVLSGTELNLYEDYLLGADAYHPALRPLTPDGATADTVRFLVEGELRPGDVRVLAVSPDATGENYAARPASEALELRGDTLLVSLLELRGSHYDAGRDVLGYALVESRDGRLRFLSPGALHWLSEPGGGPRLDP